MRKLRESSADRPAIIELTTRGLQYLNRLLPFRQQALLKKIDYFNLQVGRILEQLDGAPFQSHELGSKNEVAAFNHLADVIGEVWGLRLRDILAQDAWSRRRTDSFHAISMFVAVALEYYQTKTLANKLRRDHTSIMNRIDMHLTHLEEVPEYATKFEKVQNDLLNFDPLGRSTKRTTGTSPV